jgi:V8-like Glu-specific endopeptidase
VKSVRVLFLLFLVWVLSIHTPAYSATTDEQIILNFNIDQQTITSRHVTQPTHRTAIRGYPAPSASTTNPFLPNQVIGPDDRTRVPDTSLYPWSTVAQIEYVDQNNVTNICTGWMLGRSTVVTAAHCVYLVNASGGSNGWGRTYRVRPGRDGTTIRWECPGFYAHVPQGWVDAITNGQGLTEESRRYDWAGIDLRCRIGETTGVLGVRSTNDSDLVMIKHPLHCAAISDTMRP